MKEQLRDIYDRTGISEGHLRINRVQVVRNSPQMRIECERKNGMIENERLQQWETLLRELLLDWNVSFVYTEPAEVQTPVSLPKQKANDVEAPIPENGVLFGKPIRKNAVTAICSIEENENDTVIVGRVVSVELRDEWTREGKKPNCRVQ